MALRLRRATRVADDASVPTDTPAETAPDEEAQQPPPGPVFAGCGTTFTWQDVRQAMLDDGSWAAAELRASTGRALVAADGAGPSGTALRDAARRFRHARGLVAGEDLQAWLGRWGLSDEEWIDWLDRSLRVEAAGDGDVPPLQPDERATWAEVVFSGALETGAQRLAFALAAWAQATGGAPPPAEDPWARLRGALDDLVAQPVERRDLERLMATRAAEWLSMDLELARFSSSDAAREAVSCCRDDGATLSEVADRAGVECRRATLRAEDLEPALRAAAVSAPLGSAVPVGASSVATDVLVVWTRHAPSLDDPEVEAMAIECCADERAQAAMDRWVTWRD
jgi:hypothetical protein